MSSLHPQNIDEITQSKTNLITFKEHLTQAINGAFPTGRMPYKRVRAALFHWDIDDNTNTAESVKLIEKTFQDYGYVCRRFVIPCTPYGMTPEQFLRDVLYELGNAGEKGDLTIFYYAGHSVWDQAYRVLRLQLGKYTIPGPYGPLGPIERVARVDFTTQTRVLLDTSDATILYLLDSGYAAPPLADTTREVFAAAAAKPATAFSIFSFNNRTCTSCDNNSNSNGNSINSDDGGNWTKELCRHLRNAKSKGNGTPTPITVAQLYSQMMQSLADGKLAVTPVHPELTPSMEGRSIVLASVSASASGSASVSAHVGGTARFEGSGDVVTTEEQEGEKEAENFREKALGMVLISVQLEERMRAGAGAGAGTNASSIDDFKSWLLAHCPCPSLPSSSSSSPSSTTTTPPARAGMIELVGSFPSFPFSVSKRTLLLVLLPVEVWVCLRGDAAYSFVRFVGLGCEDDGNMDDR